VRELAESVPLLDMGFFDLKIQGASRLSYSPFHKAEAGVELDSDLVGRV